MSRLGTAVVIGIGLIGGSLAAAWRRSGFAERVVGVEKNAEAAALALQRRLVDEIVAQAPGEAELIAVCTSSEQIASHVRALAGHGGVVMDAGSVKVPILEALRSEYGGVPANFVPCHPIAGSEQSGPRAARAELFEGASVVITAEADSDPEAVVLAEAAWRAAGAEVVHLSARAHDEMLALTSHLPHLLAFAFMQQIKPELLPFTGGGFRDFTRIAGANPEMWWRILSMNKNQVLAAARDFSADLQTLTRALAEGDAETGVAVLGMAAGLRNQLPPPDAADT